MQRSPSGVIARRTDPDALHCSSAVSLSSKSKVEAFDPSPAGAAARSLEDAPEDSAMHRWRACTAASHGCAVWTAASGAIGTEDSKMETPEGSMASMRGRIDGWDRRKSEWMDEWINEGMDGWMNGWEMVDGHGR